MSARTLYSYQPERSANKIYVPASLAASFSLNGTIDASRRGAEGFKTARSCVGTVLLRYISAATRRIDAARERSLRPLTAAGTAQNMLRFWAPSPRARVTQRRLERVQQMLSRSVSRQALLLVSAHRGHCLARAHGERESTGRCTSAHESSARLMLCHFRAALALRAEACSADLWTGSCVRARGLESRDSRRSPDPSR
jgi:hypothetical protein